MTHPLRTTLDPRGLRILKRKLASGEITPKMFKDVLKRQMVKQILAHRKQGLMSQWLAFFSRSRGEWTTHNLASAGEFQAGPLDMEELFTMARSKHM